MSERRAKGGANTFEFETTHFPAPFNRSDPSTQWLCRVNAVLTSAGADPARHPAKHSRYLTDAVTEAPGTPPHTQHWPTVRPAVAIRTSGWVNITHRTDNTRRIVIQHGAHTKNGQKIAKTLHCRGPRAMPKYTQYFSSVAQTVDCVGFDTPWTCPNNLQTRNRSQFCGLRRRQRWWSAKHSRGGFSPLRVVFS